MGYAVDQALIVLLNQRAIVSLAGIFIIVWFTWQWERKWEQCGPEQSKAPSKSSKSTKDDEASSSDYQNMEEGDDPTGFAISFQGEKLPPYNKFAMFGWICLAVSHLFPRWAWIGIQFSWLNISVMFLILLVGYVQAVFIPKAIVERQYSAKSNLWNSIVIGGSFLVGILTYFQNTAVPLFAAPLGALAVAFAPMLLWKARLVGDTFDSEGRINPQPVLFNFGGPLLMFGWFWYWVGMNVMLFFEVGSWTPHLRIYVGMRMGLAMIGAVLIVFVYWATGYALDEIENLTGEPDSAQALALAPAFGNNKFFCGEVYEIKVFSIIAWTCLGLAVFFPFNWDEYTDWAFVIAAIGMGLSLAMVEEHGLRLRLPDNVTEWTTRAHGMLAFLAILVPIQQGGHYFSILLSTAGAVGFGYGMKFLHQDRKRGARWLETSEIQPPTVYSYGALLLPLGTLLLAWSVTMRPDE